MAEIVAAALTSHAPLITGKPEVEKPELRDRLYAGYHEIRRRLVAARPDLILMFVNDHLQNFPYSNMPAFCVGLADAYDAPSPGGSRLMRLPPRKVPGAPEWSMALLERGTRGRLRLRVFVRDRELGRALRPAALPAAGRRHSHRAALHELRGAPAPDSPSLSRRGRVRRQLHPVPAGRGADRRARHRRDLALGGHAGERADQSGVGPLGAGSDRARRRRRPRPPHVGRDRARRRERWPGDPELDRRARRPCRAGRARSSRTRRWPNGSRAARPCGCTDERQDVLRAQQAPDLAGERARDPGAHDRGGSRRSRR